MRALGALRIAGVDEAGRGPLAGPVVAAAVIFPPGFSDLRIHDSKRLDPRRREELAPVITAAAVAWAIGESSESEIDGINILQATLRAMQRALESLEPAPDFVLVDARKIPGLVPPQRGIIKGDTLSLSIAAGAILAKTTRDLYMIELDAKYPGYGFASHKGYSTPDHFAAMERLGVIPDHRRSFAPVRKILGLDPIQEELF